MKMTKEHFTALRDLIEENFLTSEIVEKYETGKFPLSNRVKDLNMRFRWDLFWSVSEDWGVQAGIYFDSHIDTALRKIVPTITRRY